MSPLRTDRLVIRDFTIEDTAFVLELLNEPAFHLYIGDKGVRDRAGAEKYLREGPLAMYTRHGFGLRFVALQDGTPIGSCGLLKRDGLEYPDLGFAFLGRYTGLGYAFEAASALLTHARSVLHLGPLLAVTARENPASIKLLAKLGFRFDRMIDLPGYAESSRLFVMARGAW